MRTAKGFIRGTCARCGDVYVYPDSDANALRPASCDVCLWGERGASLLGALTLVTPDEIIDRINDAKKEVQNDNDLSSDRVLRSGWM